MKTYVVIDLSKFNRPNKNVWTMQPIVILASDEEIYNNIDIDNPGFEPRDYRYHPEMELLSSDEVQIARDPTELEMFYAWKTKNQINATAELIQQKTSERKIEENRQMFLERYSGKKLYRMTDDITRMDLLSQTKLGIESLLSHEEYPEVFLRDYLRLLTCVDIGTTVETHPVYEEYTRLQLKLAEIVLSGQIKPTEHTMVRRTLDQLMFMSISMANHITIGGIGMHHVKELEKVNTRYESYKSYDYSSNYEQKQIVRISDELARLGYTAESVIQKHQRNVLTYTVGIEQDEDDEEEDIDHRVIELLTDEEYYQHKLEKYDPSKKKDRSKIVKVKQQLMEINRELDEIERYHGQRIPGRTNPDSKLYKVKIVLKKIGNKIREFFELNGRAIMKVISIALPMIASAVASGVYHRITATE